MIKLVARAERRSEPAPSGTANTRARAIAALPFTGLALALLLLLPAAPVAAPVRAAAVEPLADARAATVEITSTIEGTDRVGMAGSGAVVDLERGLVLTNAHVVVGAQRARVRTSGGAQLAATVLAEAPCDDLAVLRLESVPDDLRAFVVDGSRGVRTGDRVTALGYPVRDDGSRAPDATPTAGEVQAPLAADRAARIPTSGPPLGSMVEHSAGLIPGNSGGPLLDADGWLVGINTLAGSQSLAGTGFSVPVSRIAELLPELAAGRGVLDVGWSLVPPRDPLYADLVPSRDRKAYAVTVQETPGLWVSAVDDGSAAAGQLERGDYLTAIAGQPVPDEFAVCEALRAHRGETVQVEGRYLGSAARYDTRPGTSFRVEVSIPG
ncbi:S1C family serine protease [Pseudonocardia sp. CA-107938]|uniref:S1C family serine protease n=1 Tax=Pseudonocardia sp. CA-107938 TaxID=3240021 RepID=UPI003D940C29